MSKIGNIIKNPGVIGQYLTGVVNAMRAKGRVYQLAFNLEDNGGWYIDLPEWQGAHANLAMVAGADALLDFLCDGARRVEVEVVKSGELVEDIDADDNQYFRCDRIEQSLMGGATYQVNIDGFDRTMWLCPVTLFVLGEYPQHLYIRKLVSSE